MLKNGEKSDEKRLDFQIRKQKELKMERNRRQGQKQLKPTPGTNIIFFYSKAAPPLDFPQSSELFLVNFIH